MNDRPGCLAGILKLSLLRWAYDGLQRTFGFKSNSCMGCGCGVILLVVFILVFVSIIFGTDWLKLVQAFGVM